MPISGSGITAYKLSGGKISANNVGVPSATPYPVTLFSGGESGAYFEAHPSYCFTDVGMTTKASVGDLVAAQTDLSGNGNHRTQATSGFRPILRQDGNGKYYLETDATDDYLEFDLTLTGLTVDCAMAFNPLARDFIMFTTNATNPWGGIGQSGSASTGLVPANATQNALYFDNALSAATTRGGQYTLAQSASRALVNVDLNAVFTKVIYGKYTGGAFYSIGDNYASFYREGTLDSDERALLDTYLAGLQ